MTEPDKTTFYYFSKKPLWKIAKGLWEMTVKIRLRYPLKDAKSSFFSSFSMSLTGKASSLFPSWHIKGENGKIFILTVKEKKIINQEFRIS